ncbi:hypothetical protein KR059_000228 [Drosophila kikkawai]|nr:hypothetical protein KR059_000228 [Drosophila kikkawai]
MAALPSPPTNAADAASESKENPQGLGQGHGLKATLKPFGKITVHNVLSESGANALQQHIANQNTIIRKIRDFGMLGAVQSAAAAAQAQAASSDSTTPLSRKRPLGESKQNQQNQQQKPLPAAKRSKSSLKKLQSEKTPKTTPQRSLAKVQRQLEQRLMQEHQEHQGSVVAAAAGGTPGRKGLPLPQAVARRNARERNRVKQVNNGFALLREKIPEEVSEAFEAQGAGRGASKKLSKVETLRMAVEYIRSLEKLLGFDFPPLGRCANSSGSGSGDDSFMFIKDEFDGLDEHFDDSLSNYDMEEPQQQQQQQHQQQPLPAVDTEPSPSPSVDVLPSLTTLNGMQYIRIPGTNTYQLLTAELLGELSQEAGAGAASVAVSSPCSSPPAVGAEELLFKQESPPGLTVAYSQQEPLQQQQQQQQQILGSSPVLPAFYDQEPVSFYDNVVLPGFKKEFSDILQHQEQVGPGASGGGCLSDESMIDAIDWWEAHTPKSDGGPASADASAVLL